jgi:hypothetical protein
MPTDTAEREQKPSLAWIMPSREEEKPTLCRINQHSPYVRLWHDVGVTPVLFIRYLSPLSSFLFHLSSPLSHLSSFISPLSSFIFHLSSFISPLSSLLLNFRPEKLAKMPFLLKISQIAG